MQSTGSAGIPFPAQLKLARTGRRSIMLPFLHGPINRWIMWPGWKRNWRGTIVDLVLYQNLTVIASSGEEARPRRILATRWKAQHYALVVFLGTLPYEIGRGATWLPNCRSCCVRSREGDHPGGRSKHVPLVCLCSA